MRRTLGWSVVLHLAVLALIARRAGRAHHAEPTGESVVTFEVRARGHVEPAGAGVGEAEDASAPRRHDAPRRDDEVTPPRRAPMPSPRPLDTSAPTPTPTLTPAPPTVDLLAPPVLPSSPTPEGDLTSSGGGRRRAKRGGFVAEVAEDGTVTLRDRPILDLRPPCVRCIPGHVARRLDEWWQDPYEYQRRGRAPVRKVWHTPGSTERPDTMIYLPLLSGSFDETGDGSEAEKRRLLEATREERAGMAMVARSERERVALRELPERLERLWADRRRAPPERRRLIFELWDECDDTPAGRAARATIMGWIRRRLPAGGANGYAPDEASRLSAGRASSEPFEPYP